MLDKFNFDLCWTISLNFNGLFLLKLIIISLLWIHTVHLMSSLTDWGHWALLSIIPSTPKISLDLGSAHTEKL